MFRLELQDIYIKIKEKYESELQASTPGDVRFLFLFTSLVIITAIYYFCHSRTFSLRLIGRHAVWWSWFLFKIIIRIRTHVGHVPLSVTHKAQFYKYFVSSIIHLNVFNEIKAYILALLWPLDIMELLWCKLGVSNLHTGKIYRDNIYYSRIIILKRCHMDI